MDTEHKRREKPLLEYQESSEYKDKLITRLKIQDACNRSQEARIYAMAACKADPMFFIDKEGEAPQHFQFLSTSGIEIYAFAKSKGMSPYGAVFLIAQAATESSWGQSQGAKINNFFGVMGGSSNVKTSHGTLRNYKDIQAALNDYFSVMEEKWPDAISLYSKNNFSADDINKALNTGVYEKYPAYFVKDQAHPEDYGKALVDNMMSSVIKRIIPTIEQLIQENESKIINLQNEIAAIHQATPIPIMPDMNSEENRSDIQMIQKQISQVEKANEELTKTLKELNGVQESIVKNKKDQEKTAKETKQDNADSGKAKMTNDENTKK